MLSSLKHLLRNTFIAGLVIVLPVGMTILLLKMMFTWFDGLFAPVARQITDTPIPGLGIISTVLIIFGIGLLVTNMLGRAFVSFGEYVLARIPFIGTIYHGAKQLIEVLTSEQRQTFTQVVSVEYPKPGSHALGFVTSEPSGEIQGKFAEPMLNVFIATAPNPTTGFLLIVPKSKAIILPISVEEAMKFVVSGGILQSPGHLLSKI